MRMITRCPVCGTAFRVQAEQLAARDGQVRCGQCSTVFDAQAALVAEPEPAEPAPPPRPASKRDEEPARVEAAVTEPLGPSLPPPSEPSFSEADAEFEFGPAARGGERLRAALWGLAGLAALVALAGQVVYAYRGEIAARWPASRPWLAAACRELRCTIPLPQNAALISIEGSELAVERGASGVLTLSAVLRNRAGFAQPLPVLELTLTDATERAIARRVLQPRDYLGERAAAEPMLAPGGETAFRLHIDAQPLNATGYRLFVFYL
jgi:predicted Zn finger-like uncharacterized protein